MGWVKFSLSPSHKWSKISFLFLFKILVCTDKILQEIFPLKHFKPKIDLVTQRGRSLKNEERRGWRGGISLEEAQERSPWMRGIFCKELRECVPRRSRGTETGWWCLAIVSGYSDRATQRKAAGCEEWLLFCACKGRVPMCLLRTNDNPWKTARRWLSRKVSNQRGQPSGNEVIPIEEEERNLSSENEL